MVKGAFTEKSPSQKQAEQLTRQIEELEELRHEIDPSYPSPFLSYERSKELDEEYKRSFLGRIESLMTGLWTLFCWGVFAWLMYSLFTH